MFSTITLKGGVVVTVDLTNQAKCSKCKMAIVWSVTKNLKNMPICNDKDGQWVSHFSNCVFHKEFRKGSDRLDEASRQKERELW